MPADTDAGPAAPTDPPPATPGPELTRCPITCFTGFIGAGKSTIILSLIRQLNALPASSPTHSGPIVWLKNEFGDTAVDSLLARQAGVATTEIVNGCVCCTLVGQLDDAIVTALTSLHPSQILLETSGSSSPSTLALHLTGLSRTHPVDLAAIICVVDTLNFPLSDSASTASSFATRLQARHTDLVLLNKAELTPPDRLERVIDDIAETNPSAPRVRTNAGDVPATLVLSLTPSHSYGLPLPHSHWSDLGVLSLRSASQWSTSDVEAWLSALRRDEVFRVKGMVRAREGGVRLLNFAFGRWTWTALADGLYNGETRLTLMGDRCITQAMYVNKMRSALHLGPDDHLDPVDAHGTL